jgi:hypothetical protein
MSDEPNLEYRAEARPPRRPIALVIALVALPVLVYLLFELQRAPYRPPYDMSTLLGGGEIFGVRLLMGMLATVWLSCAAAIVWIYRRR